MKNILKLLPSFSYILHPIFVSLLGTLFYFSITHGFFFPHQIYIILIQVTILTLLLPLSLYFLLKSMGKITSFSEASLKERKFPVFIQVILIFMLFYQSSYLEIAPELYYFFQGGFWCSVLAFILLLFRVKASLHLMGMGSLVVFCMYISARYNTHNNGFIILLVLLTGLLASSRLYMKAHTYKELLIGLSIGTGTQILMWVIPSNYLL